jgi:hypothetical protein
LISGSGFGQVPAELRKMWRLFFLGDGAVALLRAHHFIPNLSEPESAFE